MDTPDPDLAPLPERHNHPYDEPDAGALIRAVQRYLHHDLLPRVAGADRWTVRVAANALAIAARELDLGPAHRSAHQARLRALGVSDDHELAATIRSGALDDRWAEVRAAVAASVADSLAVANPDYAR